MHTYVSPSPVGQGEAPVPSWQNQKQTKNSKPKKKPKLKTGQIGLEQWLKGGSWCNLSFSLSRERFSDHSSRGEGVTLDGSHHFWHRSR